MTAITRSVLYVSLTREHPAEILARRSAALACMVLVAAYVYFASASVFHAVVERTAEKNIEAGRTELAQLGKTYYALSANVNEATGASLGFVKSSNPQFAQRAVHVSVANPSSGL